MDNNILQEAARTYNTPCYIFDLDAFISRIRRMEQLLGKQVNIYYACLLYTSDAADEL